MTGRSLAGLAAGGRGLGDLGAVRVLAVAVIMFLGFAASTDRFASWANVANLAKQMSIVGVLGTGMTLVVLIGGIDLSVGSVVLLSSTAAGALLVAHAGAAAAMAAAVAAGTAVGLANGWLIERLRISPVIVTLGSLIAVRGLALVTLEHFKSWISVEDPAFDAIGVGEVLGIPASAAVMLALAAAGTALVHFTIYGRQLKAVGGNEAAARLCGVNVPLVRIVAYVACGGLAGVAGVLSAVRTGVVSPSIGVGLEFSAITVVVLGGARLSGGVGGIEGTLAGTAILVMVLNFLTIHGIPGTWQTTVTGALILGAIVLDRGLAAGSRR